MQQPDTPKRVLIFSTAYFPHVGGAEVAIREITDRITDLSFDLICAKYSRGLPSTERIGNVTVHRVGWGIRLLDKLASPLLGMMLARSLAKNQPFDAYWAMMATYGSGGAYLANIFSNKKVPIVLTLQEGDPPEYLRSKWLGLVALSWKLALRRSSAVTVISRYLGTLAQEFGYRGTPELIPNGVDIDRFKAVPHAGRTDGTTLITASRLVRKNGIDTVIRALPLLPHTTRFVVCGVGPLEQDLRMLARELAVEDRVVWRGQVSHAELPALLASADIFIRASRSEGMGNSFLEAMAVGLPTIGTDVGGITDFLTEGKTGFVVHPESPEEIADAVKRIIADPQGAADIAERGKELVVRDYDWSGIATKMRAVFARLLG